MDGKYFLVSEGHLTETVTRVLSKHLLRYLKSLLHRLFGGKQVWSNHTTTHVVIFPYDFLGLLEFLERPIASATC